MYIIDRFFKHLIGTVANVIGTTSAFINIYNIYLMVLAYPLGYFANLTNFVGDKKNLVQLLENVQDVQVPRDLGLTTLVKAHILLVLTPTAKSTDTRTINMEEQQKLLTSRNLCRIVLFESILELRVLQLLRNIFNFQIFHSPLHLLVVRLSVSAF